MKKLSVLFLAALYNVAAMAQSGGTDVDVNLKGSGGSSIPWAWIIGAIVFILLLIALLRGSGRGGRDTVVEKKTVIKD